MSSLAVRTDFKNYIASNTTEVLVDMSAAYQDIEDLLVENSLTMNDPWVGVHFLPSDEVPIAIASGNTQGKYRETGIIQIHIVGVAKLGVRDSILMRAEALRDILRGRRIGSFRVEAVSPPNFELGATLEFEAGFMSATIMLEYEHDKDF